MIGFQAVKAMPKTDGLIAKFNELDDAQRLDMFANVYEHFDELKFKELWFATHHKIGLVRTANFYDVVMQCDSESLVAISQYLAKVEVRVKNLQQGQNVQLETPEKAVEKHSSEPENDDATELSKDETDQKPENIETEKIETEKIETEKIETEKIETEKLESASEEKPVQLVKEPKKKLSKKAKVENI